MLIKKSLKTKLKPKIQSELGFVIYTYDRPYLLVNLLDSIQKELNFFSDNSESWVYIFDDASPKKQIFQPEKYSFKIHYHRFKKNHGRLKWYQEIDYIYSFLKDHRHRYYFFLNDDMQFVFNGIQQAINIYQGIDHPDKVGMNIWNCRGAYSKWVPKQPKEYNQDVWRVYWTDSVYLCEYKFLEQFNFQMKKADFFKIVKNQKCSSGVGHYISQIIHRKGKKLYLVKKSLVHHFGNGKSKMNPKERKVHPLHSRF